MTQPLPDLLWAIRLNFFIRTRPRRRRRRLVGGAGVTGGGGRGRQRRKKRSVDDGGVRSRCGPVHQRMQTASCRSRRRGAAQLAQTSHLAREIPLALYTRARHSIHFSLVQFNSKFI